jgi:hypothetical protein
MNREGREEMQRARRDVIVLRILYFLHSLHIIAVQNVYFFKDGNSRRGRYGFGKKSG